MGVHHDGVYAARLYRHDRRRLLQRLRQSSRRSPVHPNRSSISTVSRSCWQAGPNDRQSTAGIPPGTTKRPQDSVWAARLYRHDRRRLLQRLRQSSRRSPVHPNRSSISTVSRSCWQAGPNDRQSTAGIPPGTTKRPQDSVWAARLYRHDRRRLLQRLRQSSRRSPVHSSKSSGPAAQSDEGKETNTTDAPGAGDDTAVTHPGDGGPSNSRRGDCRGREAY
jgi:CRISPR/Cas system-associated endoribonuclease Cas2